ncbi:PAS domain S-box protein [Singulisphaera sp. PoT]|uniref:PAS domain-containing hybrid sensor histidine kinase/response regulator n=1 Tax=Singulisphaera sp. PoT TaxID=3411797 RepID=UPI003BF5E193
MTTRERDPDPETPPHDARLLALLEHAFDVVALTDAEGAIEYASPAIERVLGVKDSDLIGVRWAERLHPEDDGPFRVRLGEAVQRPGASRAFEARLRHEDGSWRFVQGRVTNRLDKPAVRALIWNVRDVTGLRSAEELAREKHELNARLAAIVESSDDIIASKTLDGIVTSWNRGAERILGYTAQEIVGEHISILMPPDHMEDTQKILNRIRAGEQVNHYQTRRRRTDGAIIDVSLTVSPIRDASGTIVGASKIGRDITAEKRHREERERLLADAESAKASSEAANRMKDEFLAILSHELRSPLNAIVGWVKILGMGTPSPEEIREGIAVIDRNAKAQAQIIEDLLDISRIVSGNMRLDVQRVNLAEIIEAAIASAGPAAEAKGVRLTKLLDSHAGPVSGDPVRLQQVIWNLMTNAVKFTPKGGRVQVLLERVNSHLEVSVIDTGIGIRPEFLPHVFERFRQADSSSTRRHGGLGLGLAIVKNLVELHGGTVRVKSPGEGHGSTFVVCLPLMVLDEPKSSRRAGPREHDPDEFDCSDVPLEGIRVLVVDDEADARHLIRRVLEECGAEVIDADSAERAVGLLEAGPPDILVSDIGMPAQDGLDLIRSVRARYTAKKLPAVALTAFARAEDRRRALMAGFQTHVAKPVDPAELVAVVASLVERTGGKK